MNYNRLLLWNLFSILLNVHSYGQDSLVVKETVLSENQFKLILNEEFGNLMGSQSRTNVGNYASLDLKEAEVSFSGNILVKPLKNESSGGISILGIKATGSVVDGFLPIFSNSELNSKIGIDIQYNFLLNNATLQYDYESFLQYEKDVSEINAKYDLELLKIQMGNDTAALHLKIEELEEKKKKLTSEYNLEVMKFSKGYDTSLRNLKIQSLNDAKSKIDAKIKKVTNPYKKDSLNFENDKILAEIAYLKGKNNSTINSEVSKFEIEKIVLEIKEARKKLSVIPKNKNVRLERVDNARAEELKKLESDMSKIKIYGYKFKWFSIGYGINNQSFRTFNPDLQFGVQVTKESYASHKLNFQRSIYNLSSASYESYFITYGVSIGIQDNLSSLSMLEINERINYGVVPDDRFSYKKFNAYIGEYAKNIKTISLYSNFYWFLFDDNIGAIHIYPELQLKEDQKVLSNFGTGFLLAFKNKDKTSNIVNAEVYLNLIDLQNSNNVDMNLFNRSEFGIRFAFPVLFKTNI